MADVNALVQELDDRMRTDYRRLTVWRQVHRSTGVVYTIVLILVPAVLAVGFTSSETVLGKTLLLIAAVVGGLNVTFKPYLHSQKRRADVNTMRRLRDRFRGEVAKAEDVVAVYDRYSAHYAAIFEARGRELVDGALGSESPGQEPPAPGTPNPTVSGPGAPAAEAAAPARAPIRP
ncbi:hypothetical protein ABZ816_38435 [Actinosynnema sp. NPDC047251]|uniref:Putative membrane protein n=1 Tax=Saccharothrix espanaensis (strain ATCC 51144 / DSM 44229 / JCM 9112 / NBRC 15066 / NRRL 15764) TaxID=1179773 RepID=K0JUN2_SACES|nr:hypothetical protein [Saccharothrix espanaensis]CCH29212.1 putative membrane protein [Saccharothrix espanaensis DSM 44229]